MDLPRCTGSVQCIHETFTDDSFVIVIASFSLKHMDIANPLERNRHVVPMFYVTPVKRGIVLAGEKSRVPIPNSHAPNIKRNEILSIERLFPYMRRHPAKNDAADDKSRETHEVAYFTIPLPPSEEARWKKLAESHGWNAVFRSDDLPREMMRGVYYAHISRPRATDDLPAPTIVVSTDLNPTPRSVTHDQQVSVCEDDTLHVAYLFDIRKAKVDGSSVRRFFNPAKHTNIEFVDAAHGLPIHVTESTEFVSRIGAETDTDKGNGLVQLAALTACDRRVIPAFEALYSHSLLNLTETRRSILSRKRPGSAALMGLGGTEERADVSPTDIETFKLQYDALHHLSIMIRKQTGATPRYESGPLVPPYDAILKREGEASLAERGTCGLYLSNILARIDESLRSLRFLDTQEPLHRTCTVPY